MEKMQRQEIAGAIVQLRNDILEGAVIWWPLPAHAAAFASLLVRAYRTSEPLPMLTRAQVASDDDLAWLCSRIGVTILDLKDATLRERCARKGITRLVTATPDDADPEAGVAWSFALEGISSNGLTLLAPDRGRKVMMDDAPDLTTTAMQRMRKLGYL